MNCKQSILCVVSVVLAVLGLSSGPADLAAETQKVKLVLKRDHCLRKKGKQPSCIHSTIRIDGGTMRRVVYHTSRRSKPRVTQIAALSPGFLKQVQQLAHSGKLLEPTTELHNAQHPGRSISLELTLTIGEKTASTRLRGMLEWTDKAGKTDRLRARTQYQAIARLQKLLRKWATQ